jgi:hypothetical protein
MRWGGRSRSWKRLAENAPWASGSAIKRLPERARPTAALPSRLVEPLDSTAEQGRRAAWLGRPISDSPAGLHDDERRAWRAGWLYGSDEYAANRERWQAAVRAFGSAALGSAKGDN